MARFEANAKAAEKLEQQMQKLGVDVDGPAGE